MVKTLLLYGQNYALPLFADLQCWSFNRAPLWSLAQPSRLRASFAPRPNFAVIGGLQLPRAGCVLKTHQIARSYDTINCRISPDFSIFKSGLNRICRMLLSIRPEPDFNLQYAISHQRLGQVTNERSRGRKRSRFSKPVLAQTPQRMKTHQRIW